MKNSIETMTIRDKAEEMQKLFTTSKRNDGAEYYHLRGYAGKQYPQWMQDVCYAGHIDGVGPNDCYYEAIRDIITAIADFDEEITTDEDVRDRLQEWLYEQDQPTYTLTSWLTAINWHIDYLDQPIKEGAQTGMAALQGGYIIWMQEVVDAVLAALDEAEPDPVFIPEPGPEASI